jgi:hypothetical protein
MAVLLEDALEITLADEEIDLVTLTNPATVSAIVARHRSRRI